MRPIDFIKPTAVGLGLFLAVCGCTNPYNPGQRALGGAAIGAGSGAVIGGLTGGGRGAAAGALIGGAVGAVAGAATTPTSPAYNAPPPAPAGWIPEMVWLPSPGVYVALDYTYPLFFYSGVYYYFYSGRWYSGSSYRGPWQWRPAPPLPLHRFQPNYWPTYQTRARGYYRNNPSWRHFRPR